MSNHGIIGPASASWTLINLSILIPILLALIVARGAGRY